MRRNIVREIESESKQLSNLKEIDFQVNFDMVTNRSKVIVWFCIEPTSMVENIKSRFSV